MLNSYVALFFARPESLKLDRRRLGAAAAGHVSDAPTDSAFLRGEEAGDLPLSASPRENRRIIAADDVLGEDVEVGAVGQREQRGGGDAAAESAGKSPQVEGVPAVEAEGAKQLARGRDGGGLVDLRVSAARGRNAEEGPVGAGAREVERLVERFENGEGERAEEEGDQNHAEIGDADGGEVEQEDDQRGDPRDDRADARDRHEELPVHRVVQNLGVHVARRGGALRTQVQPAAEAVPERLPAAQAEEARGVVAAHSHRAANEGGQRGFGHQEEPAGRVFLHEAVRRGDQRRVVARGALADGRAGHEGVVVDRLERREADDVRLHHQEAGTEKEANGDTVASASSACRGTRRRTAPRPLRIRQRDRSRTTWNREWSWTTAEAAEAYISWERMAS